MITKIVLIAYKLSWEINETFNDTIRKVRSCNFSFYHTFTQLHKFQAIFECVSLVFLEKKYMCDDLGSSEMKSFVFLYKKKLMFMKEWNLIFDLTFKMRTFLSDVWVVSIFVICELWNRLKYFGKIIRWESF
jgi:hypothetical protein